MASGKVAYKLLNLSDPDVFDSPTQCQEKELKFKSYYKTKCLIYFLAFFLTLYSFHKIITKPSANNDISAEEEPVSMKLHASLDHIYPLHSIDVRRSSHSLQVKGPLIHDDLHFLSRGEAPNNYLMQNIWWSVDSRNSSSYTSISNYVRSDKSFGYNSTVTLTTLASPEYLYHALELCKRWDGPISVAVFSPGYEFSISLTLIKYMRECLPKPLSACIKDKISWHLVYATGHGPTMSEISFPKNYLASNEEPLFANQNICPKSDQIDPALSIKEFEEKLKKSFSSDAKTYREKNKLLYPINALRNVARQAAKTKYILASDIELYPSINLVPQFINFMSRFHNERKFSYLKKYVFVLPIFETDAHVPNPRTMSDLRNLYTKGEAVFFHKYVCDYCQKFPRRSDWMEINLTSRLKINSVNNSQDAEISPIENNDDEVTKIFDIVQRNQTLESWEPIYIGTNDDPLYDERMSWEGRRDKMAQAYQLCLENYYLLIIENAFLVHAPGIKHIDLQDRKSKQGYMIYNNRVHDSIIKELKERFKNYPTIHSC